MSDADKSGSGFIIRNCTVRNNRARSMLLKGSDGLVENCTVAGGSMGGIIIFPEAVYWNDSDFARNLVIRNNTLRDDDYWQMADAPRAGAMTIAAYEHGRFVPLPGGHRQILVEGNTFEDDDGTNLLLSSAIGVTVRNNRFVRPMQQPTTRATALGIDPTALVWVTECQDVTFSGNILVDPGPYLKKEIEATSTATGEGFSDGITLQK